jgi:hypothetical protein
MVNVSNNLSMLSVLILSVIMLNIVMLNVVMASDVAPTKRFEEL